MDAAHQNLPFEDWPPPREPAPARRCSCRVTRCVFRTQVIAVPPPSVVDPLAPPAVPAVEYRSSIDLEATGNTIPVDVVDPAYPRVGHHPGTPVFNCRGGRSPSAPGVPPPTAPAPVAAAAGGGQAPPVAGLLHRERRAAPPRQPNSSTTFIGSLRSRISTRWPISWRHGAARCRAGDARRGRSRGAALGTEMATRDVVRGSSSTSRSDSSATWPPPTNATATCRRS